MDSYNQIDRNQELYDYMHNIVKNGCAKCRFAEFVAFGDYKHFCELFKKPCNQRIYECMKLLEGDK